MVRTPHIPCRGHWFDPWSGKSDPASPVVWPKKKKKKLHKPGTRKVRSLMGRERSKKLQSSARVIRKLWIHRFCKESKLFLSSRATSALCLLSQIEFILAK